MAVVLDSSFESRHLPCKEGPAQLPPPRRDGVGCVRAQAASSTHPPETVNTIGTGNKLMVPATK